MQCPSVVVGERTTLTCASSVSNPVASLEWFEGDVKKDNTHQQVNSPSDPYGTSSTLAYTTRVMSREDYGNVELRCCSVNLPAGCVDECSDTCIPNVLCKLL